MGKSIGVSRVVVVGCLIALAAVAAWYCGAFSALLPRSAEKAMQYAVLEDCEIKGARPMEVVWSRRTQSEEYGCRDRVVLLAKQRHQYILVAAYRYDDGPWALYERSELLGRAGGGELWERWVRGLREYAALPTEGDLQQFLHDVKWSSESEEGSQN